MPCTGSQMQDQKLQASCQMLQSSSRARQKYLAPSSNKILNAPPLGSRHEQRLFSRKGGGVGRVWAMLKLTDASTLNSQILQLWCGITSYHSCVHRWIGVATWRWVANDDNCGICRMAFDGCCPDCKIPGDDCPLGNKASTSPRGRSLVFRPLDMPQESSVECFCHS